ncbi:TPA: hypothetical protein ACJVS1_000648 [Salmonella enterica subsp. enterica serovar Montevideo]
MKRPTTSARPRLRPSSPYLPGRTGNLTPGGMGTVRAGLHEHLLYHCFQAVVRVRYDRVTFARIQQEAQPEYSGSGSPGVFF